MGVLLPLSKTLSKTLSEPHSLSTNEGYVYCGLRGSSASLGWRKLQCSLPRGSVELSVSKACVCMISPLLSLTPSLTQERFYWSGLSCVDLCASSSSTTLFGM